MRYQEIIDQLKKWGFSFREKESSVLQPELLFRPASLKCIIPKGIYFIQDIEQAAIPTEQEAIYIVNKETATHAHQIIVDNPQLVHYKLSQCFQPKHESGIHPTAIVSPQAKLGEGISIGPYCIVGDCTLANQVVLKNHVVIEDGVTLGERCFIDSHSVIGASGLAWIWDEEGHRIMQPQLGGVVVEEDCILATDVTVVRGSLSENTRIGAGSVIAHGTKIGHGSQIGKQVHMANNVSLAGNATIGDYAFLGSACVISSNINVPRHAIVGASALVSKNFEEEYITLAGVPAAIIKRNNFEQKPKGAPQPRNPEVQHKTNNK
jgi:UDP-3-O-[3-hydroxymyristoyl] glucosamine N-acyltransferase